jgi:K+-transporting ATPase KdpF subunit
LPSCSLWLKEPSVFDKEQAMSELLILGFLCGGLAAYLGYSLLKPEKF